MPIENLISRYEAAQAALRTGTATTAGWHAAQNTVYALADWLRWHGPVIREGSVYAVLDGHLMVVRGVRDVAAVEAEGKEEMQP
jgi:hypothetical protein